MKRFLKNWIYRFCLVALFSSFSHVWGGEEVSPAVAATDDSAKTAPVDLPKNDSGDFFKKNDLLFSGYVDASYTNEFGGRDVTAFSDYRSSEAAGRSFEQYDNSFNFDALKLSLEKPLPQENELSAGFRADVMYGSNAKYLGRLDPATGDGSIDFALEQAYVQVRAPVGNGLDFKIGKFVSLLGYESIDTPNNMNFSRGLLFSNMIPLTNTGILAVYKFNDILETDLGFVNGWNRSDFPQSGLNDFGGAVTGRINITAPGQNANLSNGFIYSPDGASYASPNLGESQPVFLYDLWGKWQPQFGDDKLTLGFNFDLGFTDGEEKDDNLPTLTYDSNRASTFTGAALYSKYQFTKLFSLAGRAEYLHGNNNLEFANLPIPGNGSTYTSPGPDVDVYSWTLTAGFDITEHLLARLEYRYDWSTDTIINGTDQHLIAVNVVYSF